jgi:hypothetical protein
VCVCVCVCVCRSQCQAVSHCQAGMQVSCSCFQLGGREDAEADDLVYIILCSKFSVRQKRCQFLVNASGTTLSCPFCTAVPASKPHKPGPPWVSFLRGCAHFVPGRLVHDVST